MEELVQKAVDVRERAYAPYSEYAVGAALETDSGEVFLGCNVENASYGLGMCAERVALGAAVASGHRRFRRLALSTRGDLPASPCGACRQVLAEFSPELEIVSDGGDVRQMWRLHELLPARFGLERRGAESIHDDGRMDG